MAQQRFDVIVMRGSNEEPLEILLTWQKAVRFVRAYSRDRRHGDGRAVIRETNHLTGFESDASGKRE